jgi:hypothetical protein
MRDVTLPLAEALEIWEAYNKIHDISEFVFELDGHKCRMSYVDGIHMCELPDEMRPKLNTLLEATVAFEEHILSSQLDEREVSLFLSKYFKRNAETVTERKRIRRIESRAKLEDMKDASLFARVLEDEVLKVTKALVIELTGGMVEAKIKEMHKEIN